MEIEWEENDGECDWALVRATVKVLRDTLSYLAIWQVHISLLARHRDQESHSQREGHQFQKKQILQGGMPRGYGQIIFG